MAFKKKKPTPKKTTDQKVMEKKLASARAAQAGLQTLPIPALVATIDMMIAALRLRGVEVVDFDDRDKVLHGIKVIGNRVFLLAPRKSQANQEVTHDDRTGKAGESADE